MFTVLALLVNLLLVGFAFRYANHFTRWMGQQGMKGVSKLISLLLAAIAVSLIRRGWQTT
jgi:multiple antibiotic resistance protein